MKKIKKISAALALAMLLSAGSIMAQVPPPPNGGNDGGSGGGQPVGGGAPISGGLFLLLTFGAAYGAKRYAEVYKLLKDK